MLLMDQHHAVPDQLFGGGQQAGGDGDQHVGVEVGQVPLHRHVAERGELRVPAGRDQERGARVEAAYLIVVVEAGAHVGEPVDGDPGVDPVVRGVGAAGHADQAHVVARGKGVGLADGGPGGATQAGEVEHQEGDPHGDSSSSVGGRLTRIRPSRWYWKRTIERSSPSPDHKNGSTVACPGIWLSLRGRTERHPPLAVRDHEGPQGTLLGGHEVGQERRGPQGTVAGDRDLGDRRLGAVDQQQPRLGQARVGEGHHETVVREHGVGHLGHGRSCGLARRRGRRRRADAPRTATDRRETAGSASACGRAADAPPAAHLRRRPPRRPPRRHRAARSAGASAARCTSGPVGHRSRAGPARPHPPGAGRSVPWRRPPRATGSRRRAPARRPPPDRRGPRR